MKSVYFIVLAEKQMLVVDRNGNPLKFYSESDAVDTLVSLADDFPDKYFFVICIPFPDLVKEHL